MRTHAESIEIAAPPDKVHAFLADPEKLPAWAIGFARRPSNTRLTAGS
jgi:uncharacterized protein YndB with AHSA1/START domain